MTSTREEKKMEEKNTLNLELTTKIVTLYCKLSNTQTLCFTCFNIYALCLNITLTQSQHPLSQYKYVAKGKQKKKHTTIYYFYVDFLFRKNTQK